ncbi:MAG: DUF1800 family protein [Chloracidobacterium sp.]|nr:DUF1800 family protein [Chloracidobacterium sp.]
MLCRSARYLYLLAVVSFLLAPSTFLNGQDDPNPNSPTPVLLGEKDPLRARALPDDGSGRVSARITEARAFAPGSRVILFVKDLAMMRGEGANALRLYATDAQSRLYRFPVVDLQRVGDSKGVWAVTVELQDELGFWAGPDPTGDIAVYLTWRGLASNSLKLGFGKVGGGISDVPEIAETLSATPPTAAGNAGDPQNYVGYRWSSDRRRFLEQATFGPTEALDSRVRRIGLRIWLAEQFAAQTSTMPLDPLKPSNAPADCDGQNGDDSPATCYRDTYSMYRPQTWFMHEAYYGDAQLRLRVAWALSQIWVASGNKIRQGRHMVELFKILNNGAFGNYRDLMKRITLNPAMGNYLDMATSTRTNPNENYARELMQLFTVGLFVLKPDGTLQLDDQGNPIPTYDQTGVTNMAKVFTGWSYCNVAANCPNFTTGTTNYIDPLLLNSGVMTVGGNRHDLTAKTLTLNTWPATAPLTIAACSNCTSLANIATYANTSLDQALDYIYSHQNVGPFVSKTLIQHLVTSDPTPSYVGRITAVFDANRSNPDQLREVVKAILLDPEARGDIKTDPMFGKLREPVQFATNVLRTLNVQGAVAGTQSDGSFGVVGAGRTNGQVSEFLGMSQMPFLSPSVFNFYPPGYVLPGTSYLGPEFALMNTGTSIQRANFINRMVMNTTPVAVASPDFPTGTGIDISDLVTLASVDTSGNALLDELNRRMMHDSMSAGMKAAILPAVTAVTASNPALRARTAVYLVATSSQYQVQR